MLLTSYILTNGALSVGPFLSFVTIEENTETRLSPKSDADKWQV